MHREMNWTDKVLVGKTLMLIVAATLLFTLQAIAVHAVQQNMDQSQFQEPLAIAHVAR